MILACPACRTRYLVDEQELNRPAGRTVRCANCGHTWHRPPPLEARDREPLARPVSPRVGPELEVPPRPGAGPLPTPTSRPHPRRRRAVGWVLLGSIAALLAVVILTAIIARKEVVAMWPAAARFYTLAGLTVTPPGPGLELAKIAPTRTAEGLVIEGDITNTSSTARDVPRLRVALRDTAEKETEFKIIDPPTPRLAPSETAHFKTSFDHPDEAATGVLVTFAR